jgi:hypothetical protein
VHLSALRQLFLQRSLLSPFIIEANRTLEITLKNTSASTQRANIEMTGMPEPYLSEWLSRQSREGREILTPSFMYGFAELVPLQVGKIVPFVKKTQDVQFNRLAIGTNAVNQNELTAKLYRWNDLLKNDMFISQYNDEFLAMGALLPYQVSSNIPIELHFDNLSNSLTHNVSVIAEGYHA